jgi:hypothetical protein
VHRDKFHAFIINNTDLPPSYDDEAEIEIISPVLKGKRIKWRGIYNGALIGFLVKDKEFNESVSQSKVAFKAGYKFKCLLETRRRLDESGTEVVAGYAVIRVGDAKEAKARQRITGVELDFL